MCLCLSKANLAYYWTHQPNISCACSWLYAQGLLWLQWVTVFETTMLLSALFYIVIDCWLFTPLNWLEWAASDQRLLQFGIFFPLGTMYVEVILVLAQSFVSFFVFQLTFYITGVLELVYFTTLMHTHWTCSLPCTTCSLPTCPQTHLAKIYICVYECVHARLRTCRRICHLPPPRRYDSSSQPGERHASKERHA